MHHTMILINLIFFFFNDTATTEIYTLSLHDALPISMMLSDVPNYAFAIGYTNASWTLKADLTSEYVCRLLEHMDRDRKSTRLNSSHANISYAVFCLKKKNHNSALNIHNLRQLTPDYF